MTIETKFAPGDEVWIMENNKPVGYKIIGTSAHAVFDFYSSSPSIAKVSHQLQADKNINWHAEESLFPTKADLLASL